MSRWSTADPRARGTPGASPLTAGDLAARKRAGTPIVMITAYDAPSARAAQAAGVDIVLVGDSAANTVLGYPSTRDVSLDELLMLTAAVQRGFAPEPRRPMLVGDLPFGSYESSDESALSSARRFMDAGCDGVKLEGAGAMLPRVRALVSAGIPVMGHVGLLPQSVAPGEPMRVQGRAADQARGIVADALALERAGCFAIVLEAVPAPLTEAIVRRLTVPAIGIGAGVATDGQVLVWHDLLGLIPGRVPRFVRRYAELHDAVVDALARFADDVRARHFPAAEQSYGMDEAEFARLREMLEALDGMR